jgi:hypothetical protein
VVEKKRYVAALRVLYTAEDDYEARIVAEACAFRAIQGMDQEEGEDVVITAVENFSADSLTPEEAAIKLDVARNALIKTRARDAFETAKELDKYAWALRHGSMAEYDYGTIFELAKELIKRPKEDK